MGRLEFQKLPVNTLVGADWKTFRQITQAQTVDPGYRTKYRLTALVCRLLSLTNGLEEKRYHKILENSLVDPEPLFILGHWRSGTTFVHNVLAHDKQFGYTTTYQTVFPHLMLWGQSFFKKTMAALMPDKRPTDNMELNADLPQEEEFALSNMMPYSYYNFWFFPKNMLEYCDRYLTLEKATPEEKQAFRKTFLKLIRISLWNTGRNRYLSKNPPHTGRIKEILSLFPRARFIYLIRNPYTVFESTRSFFNNTIRPLKLQEISETELESNLLEVYKRLYMKYEKDKSLLSPDRLIEIKFEDFEADPLGITENIYRRLSLPGFETARPDIIGYLDRKKGYRKNNYAYDSRTVSLVRKHWGFALDDWQYD